MKKFVMIATLGMMMAFATSASAATFVYAGGLIKTGSTGSQVYDLQSCLADMGVNPGSNIDGVFGPITKAAVMAFQSNNDVVVDGIIGKVTGPLYTAACADEDGDTSTSTSTTTTTVDDDTEGSVSSYTLGSAEETEALEGESDKEVYAVDVEMDDEGDLMLERVDVWFSQTATADDDPWEYFESVTLLVNGEEVASQDADSSNDWSDSTTGELGQALTDNEYRMRFTGVDEVLASDETAVVSIAVSMVNTIDSNDQDAIWFVEIDDTTGFKMVDGTGFVFTEGAGTTVLEDSFTVGAEELAALDITSATDEPDAMVIEVSETLDTDDVLIGMFEIEETADVDVTIDDITVTFAGSGTEADEIIKAYLVVDGDVIGSETVSASAVLFDNMSFDIKGDEKVEVEVRVDLDDNNAGARYAEGVTLNVASVTIDVLDDENGNDEGDVIETGAYAGEVHALRSEGINVALVSSSAKVSHTGDPAGTLDHDQGTFVITVDVTAFGADMYFDGTAPTVAGTVDHELAIAGTETVLGSIITDITDSTLTGTVNVDARFLVEEDDTERFDITVTLAAGADGYFEVSMTDFIYAITDVTGDVAYAFDLGDFKTPQLFLNYDSA